MLTPKTFQTVRRNQIDYRSWNVGPVSSLFAILMVAGVNCVQAQDVAPTPPAPAPAAAQDSAVIEEVIITGSSIKRADDEALPVTVVTEEQMELRDAGSPVDLLTSLPAVANVPLNESTQGGAGARGDVAAVALRGLGSGSTLVLLNGRRMAAHGITANEDGVPAMSVNANVLPARGLERVDVLRDGASSIYGSDAVAGVINFIVDTKFVGTEVEVQTSIPEIDSGADRRATITHGSYFLDDKLHWISTFDYFDRDETESSDIMGDSNKVASAKPGFNALNGPFFDRNASGAYPSYRIAGGTGTQSGTQYLVPTESGVIIQNTAPARDGASADYYYDMNTGYALPQSTRYNWYNQVDYRVNDKLTLFGELLLYRSTSEMKRPPVAYGASSDKPIVVAADNPWNPYGTDVTIQSLRFVDAGPENVEIDTDAYRIVAGGRGAIAGTWNWESAAMYSRSGTKDVSPDAIRESALQAAVASGAYNPFGYELEVVNGQVVATQPYVNSAEVIDSFTEPFVQTGRDILASVDARVTGELFDLWAGPIQVATGAEYRWDDYSLTRPQYHGLNGENDLGLDPAGNDFVQASPVGDIVGDRTVAAGFAETVIPLVAPFNEIPLVRSLSVGASIRYEHYSDFGSTSNPKFTLDYRPFDPVMIRASYNEGFRAPNLAMTNYPSRAAVGSYRDPYRADVTNLPSDGQFQRLTTTSGNSDLDPETSKGKTLGIVVDVPYVDGLRFSVDYFNIKQEGLIAGPNAEQLRANDAALLAAATQAALDAGVPLDQIDLGSGTDAYQGNAYIDRAAVTQEDRDLFAAYNNDPEREGPLLAPVGALLNTNTPFSNLDSSEIEGYDFNITYNLPAFDWGKVGISTDWTYLDKFEREGGLTGVSETQVGTDGIARVRGAANLWWSLDLWSAGLSAYYIGEYADTAASITDTVYQELGRPDYVKTVDGNHYWKVEDSVTYNAFLSRSFASETSKLVDGLTVRLGVRNLTDEAPPLTSAVAGYDASVYNSVATGRVWTLRLSKTF